MRECESAIAHRQLLLTAAHHQPDLSKTMMKALQGARRSAQRIKLVQVPDAPGGWGGARSTRPSAWGSVQVLAQARRRRDRHEWWCG